MKKNTIKSMFLWPRIRTSGESAPGLHTGLLTGQVRDEIRTLILALKHIKDDSRTNHGR